MIERAEPAGPAFPAAPIDYLRRTGVRAVERRDYGRALPRLREVARRAPGAHGDWQNLGVALVRSIEAGAADAPARVAEATAALRRAIRLDPSCGGSLAAFATLLAVHGGRPRAAARLFRHADALDPCDPDTLTGLARALTDLGDLDGAEEAARAANRADPRMPPYGALPWLLLLRGRPSEGWAALRERLLYAPDDAWGAPLWGDWPGAPEPAPGRDILALVGPVGLGDAVQLARYVPLVAGAGWRVRLHVQRPLGRLFRGLPGVHRLVVEGDGAYVRPPDAALPIILLPWRFGTPPGPIPPPAPLRPDPADVRRWRERLAGVEGLRVGLVWGSTDPRRSLRLADLAPLDAVSGVRFFGLQVGPHAAQAADPPSAPAFEDLSGEIADFADLAAILVNLDALVSADTAPVHLAGSLGVPTWVLVPRVPAWFWGLSGDATPWYPSVRLFRQERLGDWSAPVARVADELRRRAATHRLGGMSIIGVKGTDERGALVSWLPERAATRTTPPPTAAGA